MTGPEDPDEYYKQPGHPLSPDVEKGGRFQVHILSLSLYYGCFNVFVCCVENQGIKVSFRSYC